MCDSIPDDMRFLKKIYFLAIIYCHIYKTENGDVPFFFYVPQDATYKKGKGK